MVKIKESDEEYCEHGLVAVLAISVFIIFMVGYGLYVEVLELEERVERLEEDLPCICSYYDFEKYEEVSHKCTEQFIKNHRVASWYCFECEEIK